MMSPRKNHLALSIVSLLITSLACSFGGAVIGPTEGPQFSTATPGGSISISLLTTTPTAIAAQGQVTTPIAPVATQTAAAQAIVAQTATASIPSATPAGLVGSPAQCPHPGNPSLPNNTPLFSRYAEMIDEFLGLGGAPTILEASLRTWGAINEKGGLVRADRDFTGDGVPEVFVVALDPGYATRNPQPGDLFIFGCDQGTYRLLYDAGYSPDSGAPAIQSADDLNGDLINDMVYTALTCGTRGCQGTVNVIGWSITLSSFNSLTTQKIAAFQPNVVAADTNNDGTKEISVTSGIDPDPAAGPQRQITTVYQWDGTQFAAVQILKSPLQYRIHAIYDGDDALAIGDYLAAAGAYTTAIADSELQPWASGDETAILTAFARFRLMLAYALGNDVGRAQVAHDDLLNQYAAPPPVTGPDGLPVPTVVPAPGSLRPGEDFARMADLFWQNFSVNRDVKRACEVVGNYALSNPAGLVTLNGFGYANRQYQPGDLCPAR